MIQRPWMSAVLAVSVDGKIGDTTRSAAAFSSAFDKAHLQKQIAKSDALLLGAGSLRSYGATWLVGKQKQPVHIICSASGKFPRTLPFFQMPVRRWLVTTHEGARRWRSGGHFDETIVLPAPRPCLMPALTRFYSAGIKRIAVLGGGDLLASLMAEDAIDELWLTVCPILIGGSNAPTPLDGKGFRLHASPQLRLSSARRVQQEVLLHYVVKRRGRS